MDLEIKTAILAASVTAMGWLVTHILSIWRDDLKHSREKSLAHTEKQLSELYGPLAFLVYEGRQTFTILQKTLGRKAIFPLDETNKDQELATWRFWAENDFRPRNMKIKDLLLKHPHLIEGGEMPQSYVDFLNHHSAWELDHLRWEQEQIEYEWHARVNWPTQFESDIVATYQALQKRRASLLRGWSSLWISIPWLLVILAIGYAVLQFLFWNP
jgi:hypothetical protein